MKSPSNLLILILSVITTSICYGFPEYIREGYGSCSACHVQPNGGGPLKPYGRTISGENLSTFGTEEKGGVFYGLPDLSPLFDVAGDFRYLDFHHRDETVDIRQKFVMQKEISLVFTPASNVTFVASGGYYGFEPKDAEYRRYFGIVNLGRLWLRVGRFLPAFGYNIPDHTKGIKELFGQGKETLNSEIGYQGKAFEIIATRVVAGDALFKTGTKPTVRQKEAKDGATLTLGLHPFQRLHLGVSSAWLEDASKVQRYVSYTVSTGLARIYALGEYQSYPKSGDYRAYGEVGFIPFKGFHIKAEYDANPLTQKWYGTVQWFPYPHFELSYSMSDQDQIFVSHYYL